MQLNLKSNSITQLQNVSIPSTVQTLDLSKNSFASLQNFAFPSSLTKFLYNYSFPNSVTTLNLSNNPIASIGGVVFPSSLKVLSITSTVKLIEFEVRRTDATLFESLQTFNVSTTTSLTCSDSDALVRYVQETLLCVLEDDVFDIKYGIKSESSASGSVDGAVTPAPVLQEANNPRRSKFLVFAAISLFLACIGLMSTLAPRTLYDRYQKKKLDLLKKNHELLHLAPTTPSMPRCGECEADTASLRCEQCDVSFCASCDANVHKFKSLQKHTRVNLSDKAKAILQVHEHDPNIGYWDL
ncbi:TKL protein kinase [Phytophthora megakarya]|uniref:TKL protein kinase n=1 Tax=Phytophthora megakarya TaxID=4795 RepID=A0A225VG39_9STRA|nr:TKL protein kinase [Phytophthora megakarya]